MNSSRPPVDGSPATVAPAPQADAPGSVLAVSRRVVLASFVALTVLGLVWEFWLAPLRPGGSMLALKVLPLALSIPALRASRLRAYQAWSMGILLYLCEGLVRATSDRGLSVPLAILETVLALIAFVALLAYARGRRLPAPAPAT
ncbi:MAG: DUF2069 domain-containing protein [Burkholderiales bacterium]|nr:DUF2069 domain-containing protein [Burkholderiales bacterium]